ncbi:hypothetical protein ACFY4C_37170 [Actinomadura viridis]|uniref:hypothetical protein n=1 Tax=Actinomadura viridis TaxID=58110 RepID=UPI003694ABF3
MTDEPRKPDVVIAGYALLFGELVGPEMLAQLRRVGDAPDGVWAALFIYDRGADGSQRRWTLFSADRHYAEQLAARVGKVRLDPRIAREKFPAFQAGWSVETE